MTPKERNIFHDLEKLYLQLYRYFLLWIRAQNRTEQRNAKLEKNPGVQKEVVDQTVKSLAALRQILDQKQNLMALDQDEEKGLKASLAVSNFFLAEPELADFMNRLDSQFIRQEIFRILDVYLDPSSRMNDITPELLQGAILKFSERKMPLETYFFTTLTKLYFMKVEDVGPFQLAVVTQNVNIATTIPFMISNFLFVPADQNPEEYLKGKLMSRTEFSPKLQALEQMEIREGKLKVISGKRKKLTISFMKTKKLTQTFDAFGQAEIDGQQFDVFLGLDYKQVLPPVMTKEKAEAPEREFDPQAMPAQA